MSWTYSAPGLCVGVLTSNIRSPPVLPYLRRLVGLMPLFLRLNILFVSHTCLTSLLVILERRLLFGSHPKLDRLAGESRGGHVSIL